MESATMSKDNQTIRETLEKVEESMSRVKQNHEKIIEGLGYINEICSPSTLLQYHEDIASLVAIVKQDYLRNSYLYSIFSDTPYMDKDPEYEAVVSNLGAVVDDVEKRLDEYLQKDKELDKVNGKLKSIVVEAEKTFSQDYGITDSLTVLEKAENLRHFLYVASFILSVCSEDSFFIDAFEAEKSFRSRMQQYIIEECGKIDDLVLGYKGPEEIRFQLECFGNEIKEIYGELYNEAS